MYLANWSTFLGIFARQMPYFWVDKLVKGELTLSNKKERLTTI